MAVISGITTVPAVSAFSKVQESNQGWAESLQAAQPAAKTSKTLPLGDGQYTSAKPTVGQVFISPDYHFNPSQGASKAGPWIDQTNKTYTPADKPVVAGDNRWQGTISNVVAGKLRLFDSNGVPPSSIGTGTFPIDRNSVAAQYDQNPNSIAAKPIHLELPANPQKAAQSSPLPPGMIGVTTTGVAIFNALDEKGKDAAANEIQDKQYGHPEMSSQYHYHEIPPDLVASSYDSKTKLSGVVGYALDGFPITGNKVGDQKLTTKDLDVNHGTTGMYMQDGKAVSGYHYVATEDYPHTLSAFAGTPVLPSQPGGAQGGQSGQGMQGMQGGQGGQGMQGAPPQGGPPQGTQGSQGSQGGPPQGMQGAPPQGGPPSVGAVNATSILKTLQEAASATSISDKAAFVQSGIQQLLNYLNQDMKSTPAPAAGTTGTTGTTGVTGVTGTQASGVAAHTHVHGVDD